MFWSLALVIEVCDERIYDGEISFWVGYSNQVFCGVGMGVGIVEKFSKQIGVVVWGETLK